MNGGRDAAGSNWLSRKFLLSDKPLVNNMLKSLTIKNFTVFAEAKM